MVEVFTPGHRFLQEFHNQNFLIAIIVMHIRGTSHQIKYIQRMRDKILLSACNRFLYLCFYFPQCTERD